MAFNISIPAFTDFKDSVPGPYGASWCLWHRHHKSNRLQYSFMLLSILGFYLLEFLFNLSIDVYFNILKSTISVCVTFPLLSLIPANKIMKKLCSETIFQGLMCLKAPLFTGKLLLMLTRDFLKTQTPYTENP